MSKCGKEIFVQPTWVDPTIKGEVDLDATASSAIAQAVCKYLTKCITDAVEGYRFGELITDEITVNKKITLGASLKMDFIDDIVEQLETKLPGILEGATLTKITVADGTLDTMTVQKALDKILATPAMIGAIVELAVAQAWAEKDARINNTMLIGNEIKEATITASTADGLDATNSRLVDTHLSGRTTLLGTLDADETASKNIADIVIAITGVHKLISSEGQQLTGEEGIVTGDILLNAINNITQIIAELPIVSYRDEKNAKIKEGTKLVTLAYFETKWKELEANNLMVPELLRSTQTNTENILELTRQFDAHRDDVVPRMDKLEAREKEHEEQIKAWGVKLEEELAVAEKKHVEYIDGKMVEVEENFATMQEMNEERYNGVQTEIGDFGTTLKKSTDKVDKLDADLRADQAAFKEEIRLRVEEHLKYTNDRLEAMSERLSAIEAIVNKPTDKE